MDPVVTKKRPQGAHEAAKSSVTRRQAKKRSSSAEEVNPSPAKRPRLLGRPREETPVSQQQPTPAPSTNSGSSGRDSHWTATTPSTVSTWLNSFDSNQETDSQSSVQISKSLAPPPPDKPEQAPADCEDLDIKSIDWNAESSEDDMAGSTKSSTKTYRAIVAEPMFRKQRLEGNNIWFRNHLRDVPADVMAIIEQIRHHEEYPEPSPAEYKRLDSMIWGIEEAHDEEALLSLGNAWVTKIHSMNEKDDQDNQDNQDDQDDQDVTMEDSETTEDSEDSAAKEDTGIARTEGEVKTTLEENLLPIIKAIGGKVFFKHMNNHPVDRQAIPSSSSEGALFLPRPVPDTLFGHVRTFLGRSPVAESNAAQANDAMSYPFMSVEYKSPGSNKADTLWVGTNQVVMGCLACSHISWKMSELMAKSKLKAPNTTAFGIVTNGTETRLHVSWREEINGRPKYIVAFVEDFLLTRRDEYKKLRMYIFNIFRWAKSRHELICKLVKHKHPRPHKRSRGKQSKGKQSKGKQSKGKQSKGEQKKKEFEDSPKK
ncbi:hypothetical protein F4805DRAFT_463876 [Annulohypoxylon moriforme]|nr:hypothetical protein F4805DRAFT_463876 [Annulohypoxylon moriforme]